MVLRIKGLKKGDKKVLIEVIIKECIIYMYKRIYGMYVLFVLYKLV